MLPAYTPQNTPDLNESLKLLLSYIISADSVGQIVIMVALLEPCICMGRAPFIYRTCTTVFIICYMPSLKTINSIHS
jgi:hypothetical protein